MNKELLQKFLNERIPISRAIGIKVLEAGPDNVAICAPLAPNINHIDAAFGGSVSAVAMLSAWSLLHIRHMKEGIDSNIVIYKASLTFERPIDGVFTSTTVFDNDPVWKDFVLKMKTIKKAGLELSSVLTCGESAVGRFEGFFVSYSD